MPRKTRISKRSQVQLSDRQKANLICGPYHPAARAPVWRNDDERREAWEAHRDELIAMNFIERPVGMLCGSGKGYGTRPLAWWQYDAPELRRDGESEYDYINRMNLLTDAEKQHFDNIEE